jgi:hypothetical protein
MVSEVRPARRRRNVDGYLAHLKVGSITHGVASHAGDAHLRPADHSTRFLTPTHHAHDKAIISFIIIYK